MIFDNVGMSGPRCGCTCLHLVRAKLGRGVPRLVRPCRRNVYTMWTEIGTIQTLDVLASEQKVFAFIAGFTD